MPAAAAVAGALFGLFWLATLLRFHAAGRDFPELDEASHPEPPAAEPPRISLVVAAKDEEENIEGCLRSVLAQDYPELHVIAVDDRSSDATPQILAHLAAEVPDRLEVVRIEQVPAGWGGQNHGLHLGAQSASGEWLCFTDADCRFDSPRTLSVAWREAVAHGLDFLSILPRMAAPTAWEKVYMPLCSFLFLIGLDVTRSNDPDSDAASAYGPFMLIRRAAYEALGGHVRVRDLINGDVSLARIAKSEGLAYRLTGNADLYHTHMYGAARAAWSGWSRNFYNSIQSRSTLLSGLVLAVALFLVPWSAWAGVGVAAGLDPAWRPAAAVWGGVVLVSHAGLWRLYRAFAIPPRWSLLYPAGALFVVAISARATLCALLRTGTTWHGVRYAHPVRIPPHPGEAPRP